MHIPDGFIDVQTSAIFAGLAAGGVAASLKGCLLYTSDAADE